MAPNTNQRPEDAVLAALALADADDRSVVGIGEYVAFHDPPNPSADDADGETILVCRISGLDHGTTSDRAALHSNVLFETDAETAADDLRLSSREESAELTA